MTAPLLRGHPEIDELFVIPKKRWRKNPVQTLLNGEKSRFYHQLRQTKWDAVIDFQGLTKSGWPAWRSGAPLRIGFGGIDSREINGLFINKKIIPPESARHVIERNMSLLQPLGITSAPIDWLFPDLSAEEKELDSFFRNLASPGGSFIALNPGAGWETKRWPAELFAGLAQLLSASNAFPRASRLPMVIIWGPGEEALCDQILHDAALPPDILMLAPRTSLRQLAALLGKARLIVGGDTGPVHLAAALKVPVVGIYGGSDPIRNGAWGDRNVVIQGTGHCTVCWKTKCNHTHKKLECLSDIEPERVARAVEEMLSRD